MDEGGGAPTGVRAPRGTGLRPGGVTCPLGTQSHGARPQTRGHWRASACMPRGTAARPTWCAQRDVTRGSRSSSRSFQCSSVCLDFSQKFVIGLHQGLNTRLFHLTTLYHFYKGS
jgi:hypothetical protein